MLHRWDGIIQVISGACFPSDMNKELRFIRPENIFFHSQSYLGVFLSISIKVSCIFEFGPFAIKQGCLSFCKFLPSPYKIMELNQSDHRCLDHLSNQDLSPSIAQFGLEARSRKSPDCIKLHPLGIMEAKCSCEPSTLQHFCVVFPRSVSTLSCLSALQAIILTSGLSFCSDIHFNS